MPSKKSIHKTNIFINKQAVPYEKGGWKHLFLASLRARGIASDVEGIRECSVLRSIHASLAKTWAA